VSLQFRSKLATQTSEETEDDAEFVDIDLEGEAAGSAQPAGPSEPIVGPSSRPPAPPPATHSTPSLSSDVMPLLPVRPKRSTARAQADCNDNAARSQDCTDKLFKICPLVDSLQSKVSNIIPEEKLSIDEQVVPFKKVRHV